MTDLNSRVAKLEAQVGDPPKVVFGFIDYDVAGECVAVTLNGRHFERIDDESEAAMLARAEAAAGPVDTLIWVSWERPRGVNLS